MKSNFTKICLVLVFAFGLFVNENVQAQDINFNQYLKADPADANRLMENYISPFMDGFGFGMASGWYNTAKAHKTLGFDITATVNLAKVPSSGYSYEFVGSEYNSVTATGGNQFPTIFGGNSTSTLSTTLTAEGQSITSSFAAPDGADLEDFGYVPTPMVQLGIGIYKNTDLKLRYIPTTSSDDFSIGLFGIGVMHDFKQWIPGLKQVPIDLSVFVGYTKMTSDFNLPEIIGGANQAASLDVTAITYQILVSKKLSILTLYGGFGYNNVSSSLKMTGTYEIEDLSSSAKIVLTDPINLEFSKSGARATIGARLKLAILTIHADYTAQEYNTISVGLGFSIR